MTKRTLFLCSLLLNVSGIIAQKPGDKVLSVFVDEYDHQWFGTDRGLLRRCGDIWKAYNTQACYPGTVNDIEHQNTGVSILWCISRTS